MSFITTYPIGGTFCPLMFNLKEMNCNKMKRESKFKVFDENKNLCKINRQIY